MALIRADRVQETSVTSGTGTYTLAGAVQDYRAFSSVCSNADTVEYVATDGTSWEVGLGTYNANTLARTSLYASSTGSAINWSGATLNIWNDIPAKYFETAVSATGSPLIGQLVQFSSGNTITNVNLSGDVSTGGSAATTLATVNANVGTFQGITVNAKGLVTAAVNQGYGTGSVTSVSVVTANGVSGSVATATTTPAITLTLGAITPSSVVASGNITGAVFIPTGNTVPSNGLYLNTANSVALATNGTIGLSVDSSQTTTAQGALQSVGDLKVIGKFTVLAASGDGNFVGNVTAANLSGTNTGDVTLAGENYLSRSGQVITANAVNLSGTNVIGTLAAGRFPALTGDITTVAGALATTLATVNSNVGSFTNASVTVNAKGLVTAASSGTAPVTSVSGTTNRITITGTTTPTVDIAATYVGQTSITTLGTIAVGVWNAGAVTSSGVVTGTAFVPTGTSIPTYGLYKFDATTLALSCNSVIQAALNSSGALTIVGSINSLGSQFACNSVQVVGARNTGWTAATGSSTKGGFAAGSVTLPNLAQNVKAILDALITHGLIGT